MICATLVNTHMHTHKHVLFFRYSAPLPNHSISKATRVEIRGTQCVYWPNSRVVKWYDDNKTYSLLVYLSTIFVGFHLKR